MSETQRPTQRPTKGTSPTTHLTIKRIAALSAAVAIMVGAFGAHGLSGKPAEWLNTGARYQLTHAVAILVSLSLTRGVRPAQLFVVGTALFSGSLYAMAMGAPRVLGAITPLGGLAFIAGWLTLAFTFSEER